MNPLNLGNSIEKEVYMNLFNEEKYEGWKKKNYSMKPSIAEEFEEKTKKPHVLIIGDYDVDGIMSTKESVDLIREIHPESQVSYIIPKRFTDGYGISQNIVDAVLQEFSPKDTCIITVDNGISQFHSLNQLYEAGYTIILTDHHTPQKQEDGSYKLPLADMIINPHVLDEKHKDDFTFEHYCGAGVVYQLAKALLPKELVRTKFLPYAAIATIADIMPLIEDNWVMVHNFLEQIGELFPPELNFTDKPAKYISEEDIGFGISPVLNAAGRLLDNGAEQVLDYIFSPTKEKEAVLRELNKQRKELSNEQTAMVVQYIEEHHLSEMEPICVNLPGLHHGIVGIIAGNISERYDRACMICSDGRGSGRGTKEFDIYSHCVDHFELFSKCGGHPGACGFSITDENFAKFAEYSKPTLTTKKKEYDIKLQRSQITEFYLNTKKFRPFGEENPAPRCMVSITPEDKQDIDYMGKVNPIHFSIKNSDGSKIVHFNHLDSTTGHSELKDDNIFEGIGTLTTNYYNPAPKINPYTKKPYPQKSNQNPLTIQLKLEEVYDPEDTPPIDLRR